MEADHCLPEDAEYERRVDAIRAAVAAVSDDNGGGHGGPGATNAEAVPG